MPLQYVEDNGGQQVTLGGATAVLPLDEPLFVYAVSDGVEIPCYSGVAGSGLACFALTTTTIAAVMPPLPPRGSSDLAFIARDADGVLVATFTAPNVYVVNRYFRDRTFGFRSLFPPRLATGPRSLNVTDPLDEFSSGDGAPFLGVAVGAADVIISASGATGFYAEVDGDATVFPDVEASGAMSYTAAVADGDAEVLDTLFAEGAMSFGGWTGVGAADVLVDASGTPSYAAWISDGDVEIETLTIASDGSPTFGWESDGVAIVVQALSPLSAWPVGSVFIAVSDTSPVTLLGGGTWVEIGQGRVLVGRNTGDVDFDVTGETGGAKTSSVSAHTGTAVAAHAAHTHSVTSNVSVGNHVGHSHGSSASTTVSIDDHPAHQHGVTTNVAVSVSAHAAHYHQTSIAAHASHTHTYTDVVAHRHDVTIASGQGSHVHPERTFITASGGADSGFTRNNVMSGGLGGSTTATTATATLPSMGGNAVSGLGVDMVATGTTNGPSATLSHATTTSTQEKLIGGADTTLTHSVSVTNNAVSTGLSIALAHFASASTSVSVTSISDQVHSVTNGAVNSGTESASLTHSVTQPSAHSPVSTVQPYLVVRMWSRTA